MSDRAHWDHVYATKAAATVSWFQATPATSLALIEAAQPDRAAKIGDVGAGASALVDGLLAAGFRDITALDLAASPTRALLIASADAARSVTWIAGDVLTHEFPAGAFDVWHDRAVFHFLTSAEDRAAYVATVRHALRPGGHVIIGTFAEDGPRTCSGLDVCRYSAEALHKEFGAEFALVSNIREAHRTPGGSTQQFQFCTFRFDALAVHAAPERAR
jgi:2-polyprenyl-3-methyl-5-hydroxy-6-metoxy-1,4-benzoquinol methylase